MKLKITLIFLSVGYSTPLATAKQLEIKNKDCIYSIDIPLGWKEIPTDSIAERFGGIPFDAGLHNSTTNNYFNKSYLQYTFLKSQKSLNQFSFVEIAQEAQKSIDYTIENPKIGDNTLKVTKYKIDKEKQLFFIKGKIANIKREKKFLQVMIPTKNGYIKVMLYSPLENEMPLSYTEIAETIRIGDDYIYHEPQQEFTLGFKHVILAIIISVLVFSIIQFYPKLKQVITNQQ